MVEGGLLSSGEGGGAGRPDQGHRGALLACLRFAGGLCAVRQDVLMALEWGRCIISKVYVCARIGETDRQTDGRTENLTA